MRVRPNNLSNYHHCVQFLDDFLFLVGPEGSNRENSGSGLRKAILDMELTADVDNHIVLV